MNKTFKLNDKVKFRKTGDIFIAYSKEEGTIFEFNETGSIIFEYISEGLTYDEIFEKLCSDFDISTEDIKDDVNELIDRLIDLKVLY